MHLTMCQNDVTRFWPIFHPLFPLCHMSSDKVRPPSNMMSQNSDPSPRKKHILSVWYFKCVIYRKYQTDIMEFHKNMKYNGERNKM